MVKTYDPSQMVMTVNTTIVSDFEEITVTFNEADYVFEAGSAGEVARTRILNKIGQIKVSLAQTNSINKSFSTYRNSTATVAVALIDMNSKQTIYSMPYGSINHFPESGFAKDKNGTRDWTFEGDLPIAFIAGN